MRCEFSALIVQIQQDPLKHKYRIIYKDFRSLNRFQRLLPLHSSKICQASYSRIAIWRSESKPSDKILPPVKGVGRCLDASQARKRKNNMHK